MCRFYNSALLYTRAPRIFRFVVFSILLLALSAGLPAPVSAQAAEVGVTISTPYTSPITGRSSVPVTITFTEPVIGFSAGDVAIQNGWMDEFTERNRGPIADSYSVFTFMLSARFPSGARSVEVRVSVPAGAASAAGSGAKNLAAAPLLLTFATESWTPPTTGTATSTATATSTPTATATATSTPTATNTTASTGTSTPLSTATPTSTATPSSTSTPSRTPTATASPTRTATPSSTPTATKTPLPDPGAACPAGPSAAPSTLQIVPGLTGFGETAVAGSGRHLATPCTTIFRVKSLADTGAGTLRECVEAKVPRTCVFEIAGRISLKSDLMLTYPYITIAGQTAPSPGIMLSGATLRIEAPEVLVQHVAFRPGDENTLSSYSNRDGIGIRARTQDVYNVVIDHVSISWAIDENIGIFNAEPAPYVHDITVSNSIIAEGLYKSKHSAGPHGMGMLVGEFTKNVSVQRVLLAHNNKRNPMIKGGVTIELINNVVYDWQGQLGSAVANISNVENIDFPVLLNFIGNLYKPGAESYPFAPVFGDPIDPRTRVYVYANIGPTRPADAGDEWLITSIPESPHRSLQPVIPLTNTQLMGPEEAFEFVLGHSGARLADRALTKVDARIVNEVRSGTGKLKDCVSGCSRNAGGWPALAVVQRNFNAPADPGGDSDGDGYTDLEELLQQLAEQLETAP